MKNSIPLQFVGLTSFALITLKLAGVITWPWLWVLSPLWISAGVVVGILVFGFVVFAIYGS